MPGPILTFTSDSWLEMVCVIPCLRNYQIMSYYNLLSKFHATATYLQTYYGVLHCFFGFLPQDNVIPLNRYFPFFFFQLQI